MTDEDYEDAEEYVDMSWAPDDPNPPAPPVERNAPQLANPIKFTDLDRFVHDEGWGFEQKIDGHHLMIRVVDGVAQGLNREGEPKGRLHPDLAEPFSFFNGRWLFDGELIDGLFYAYDCPRIGPEPDFAREPYEYRRTVLNRIFEDVILPHTDKMFLLPTFIEPADKVRLMQACVAGNSEGVMAKRLDAPYVFGHRSAAMLKAKLWASADCVITEVGVDGKNSVAIAVYEGGKTYPPGAKPDVFLGHVTVNSPKKFAALNVGDVIEVKYLYATPGKRRLYQASLLRMRPDRTPQSCDTSQLKIGDKKILDLATLPKGS